VYSVEGFDVTEKCFEKDLEGSGHALIYSTIPEYAWRGQGTPEKKPIRKISPGQDSKMILPEHRSEGLLLDLTR
jgi:hypothetical protein